MWFKNEFFKVSTAIIFVLIIIFLAIQLQEVLNIFVLFVSSILLPILLAGTLYYILRPARDYLEEKKIPRTLVIVLIFLFLIAFFSILITYIWPVLSHQVLEIFATPEEKLKVMEENSLKLLNSFSFRSITKEEFREYLFTYSQDVIKALSLNILPALSSIFKVGSLIIATPFFLFYFMKDDFKITDEIIGVVPVKYTKLAKTLTEDVDFVLSNYITSQFIVACIVGFLIFIGYSLIGLKYSIALATIALIFNLIPFAGPFISTIPAIIVGLSTSNFMVFQIIAVVLIVHLIDVNFISPRIVSRRMNIHPLTVIILLISSFSIMGVWGLFIITPLYLAIKVIIRDLSELKIESETAP